MTYNLLKAPTKQALDLVRHIVATNTKPLSTKDIYKLAVKLPVLASEKYEHICGPIPPQPNHPIRSVAYLKNRVLPTLQGQQVLEKFHTTRTLTPVEVEQRLRTTSKGARREKEEALLGKPVDVWLWRMRTGSLPTEKKKDVKKLFGWEVGAGEDWSHLSKRRERARKKKVKEDVLFMAKVRQARRRLQNINEEKTVPTGGKVEIKELTA